MGLNEELSHLCYTASMHSYGGCAIYEYREFDESF